jgi:hypothetical protein
MSAIDLPAALDLFGTVLSILGGLLSVVPPFREARFKKHNDGIKSWIAQKEKVQPDAPVKDEAALAQEQEEVAALKATIQRNDDRMRDLRNSSVRYLQVGIFLLTVGLVISLPAKWVATFNDPCAQQAKCRSAR